MNTRHLLIVLATVYILLTPIVFLSNCLIKSVITKYRKSLVQ